MDYVWNQFSEIFMSSNPCEYLPAVWIFTIFFDELESVSVMLTHHVYLFMIVIIRECFIVNKVKLLFFNTELKWSSRLFVDILEFATLNEVYIFFFIVHIFTQYRAKFITMITFWQKIMDLLFCKTWSRYVHLLTWNHGSSTTDRRVSVLEKIRSNIMLSPWLYFYFLCQVIIFVCKNDILQRNLVASASSIKRTFVYSYTRNKNVN